MTESDYWSKLRKAIAGRIYTWKIQASYVKGVPDWWTSGIHQDLWVENKRIVGDGEPPAILDLTDHKKYLTLHQQDWLQRRHDEGRNVGVVVFSRSGHIFLPGLRFKEKVSKLDFLEKAMTYKDLAEHLIAIVGEMELK